MYSSIIKPCKNKKGIIFRQKGFFVRMHDIFLYFLQDEMMVIVNFMYFLQERKITLWFISGSFRLIKKSNQGALVICKYFWQSVVYVYLCHRVVLLEVFDVPIYSKIQPSLEIIFYFPSR